MFQETLGSWNKQQNVKRLKFHPRNSFTSGRRLSSDWGSSLCVTAKWESNPPFITAKFSHLRNTLLHNKIFGKFIGRNWSKNRSSLVSVGKRGWYLLFDQSFFPVFSPNMTCPTASCWRRDLHVSGWNRWGIRYEKVWCPSLQPRFIFCKNVT